jgi:adenosylcobinamide kinase/adenosylcobinamide-phosphate guanylyltransferase
MTGKQVILIGGGSRSGKSAFALALARRLGRRRLFLATAEPGDEEMRQRIECHRRTRGDDFDTREEPLALPEAIRQAEEHDVVVCDCLTLWLANLLCRGLAPEAVAARVEDLAAALADRTRHAVVVTNEVGLGLVPETALGRQFRDLAGLAHQRLAEVADEVYFSVLGTLLRLKPAPAFIDPREVAP